MRRCWYYTDVPSNSNRLLPLSGASQSLTEQVVVAVRDSIRQGLLTPGVLYSVYQLAAQLGVSRSPVRDALLRLEQAGLVRFERNRGFRILLPDASQIAEIFDVRLALEVPAARRAALRKAPTWKCAVDPLLAAAAGAASRNDKDDFFIHDFNLHDLILQRAANERSRAIVADLRSTITLISTSTAEGESVAR